MYRDVANIEAMKERNLTSALMLHLPPLHIPPLDGLLTPSPLVSSLCRYRDICDPSWLQRDPGLFFGFWGKCFNDYRDAIPHYGYDILRRWRDERFHPHTPIGRRIRREMERLMGEQRERKRRKGAASEDWGAEGDVHMERDAGIVHPPSPPPVSTDVSKQTGEPLAVAVEGERAQAASSFNVGSDSEGGGYSASVHQMRQSVRLSSKSDEGVQEATVTSESFIGAIHSDHHPSSLDTAHLSPASPPIHPSRHSHPHATRPSPAAPSTTSVPSRAPSPAPSLPPALGPFFSLTSNVDAHFHRTGFDASQLYEIHGNSETWQCSQLCAFDTWTPPPHFRFTINPTTLTCTRISPPPLCDMPLPSDDDGEGEEEVVTVHRWTPSSSFLTNVPLCPLSHLARPSILMFNDETWIRNGEQEALYLLWMHAVLNVCEEDEGVGVVVLEVGCGLNVPTVRWRSESVWQMVQHRRKQPHSSPAPPQSDDSKEEEEEEEEEEEGEREGKGGGEAKLGRRGFIRVNVQESAMEVEGRSADCISVDLTGLMALQILDRLLEAKRPSRGSTHSRGAA